MKTNKITSNLKNHKYKKGLIQTPINTFSNIQTLSWTNDRLPEYLWLGLILVKFKRTNGIEKAVKILKEISQIDDSIIKPKLSTILSLSVIKQEEIYKIICNKVNPKILAPLTVIYRNSNHSIFNKYFNYSDLTISDRIDILNNAIKLYYNHQSYEATDLRFIVSSMIIFQNKLHVTAKTKILEVFENYPYINHDDDKMKSYRPSIRVVEMIGIENQANKKFINNFWKEIGLKTKCKPMLMSFNNKGKAMNYKKYILGFQEKLNHLLSERKEQSLLDDKFDVIIGTITYTLKIFNDVVEKSLDDTILGRHAYRTILEAYISIKYLLKIEGEKLNIWEEYKLYGIGKYKLPLLKNRENTDIKDETHFMEPIIDAIVNEILFEEFIDIDLRYFDKKKIKEKFEEVGEKKLYEVLYEYDNNFIHGFWGAVRESSMLHCDNATHKYHSIPDINFEQKMPSVNNDIYKIIHKFSKLINEVFQHEYK